MDNRHKDVEAKVLQLISQLNEHKDEDLKERTRKVMRALGTITNSYGTAGYEFNLAIELFVEKATEIEESLLFLIDLVNFYDNTLVDDDGNETPVADIIFSAYYALSLIYKKNKDVEGLKSLLDEKYDVFQSEPLCFEVHSRYYKRIKDWTNALESDRLAMNLLKYNNIENPAVWVSFASTVCSMLEAKEEVEKEDIVLAVKYVDAAIAFNPNYPKYYFIKAKLIFFSTLGKDNLNIEENQKEIDALIDKANVVLHTLYGGTSVYSKKTRLAYTEFRNKVVQEYKALKADKFGQVKAENVPELKGKILSSNEQKTSYAPPNPKLSPSDKYVFICYSSKDYKSVYCDLLELYANKIPFKYDFSLKSGEQWKNQVEKIILNDNCVCAVFYIGKNTIISDGLCNEIKMVCNSSKKFFCVNLEGTMQPSEVAISTIVELAQQSPSNTMKLANNLKVFLNAFDDDEVYIPKFPNYHDDGAEHIPNLIEAINNYLDD